MCKLDSAAGGVEVMVNDEDDDETFDDDAARLFGEDDGDDEFASPAVEGDEQGRARARECREQPGSVDGRAVEGDEE